MLRHPNPWVRWQCATLPVGVVNPASIPAVVAALRDPVPKVRKHALFALVSCEQKLGVDIVPVLIERARRDDNDHVRSRFIGAMVERPAQPRVAEALALHSGAAGSGSSQVGAGGWPAARIPRDDGLMGGLPPQD